MNYFTGIGGFSEVEGTASCYRGPVGQLLGGQGAFSASVMFLARTPIGAATQPLFAARTTGPDTGWQIYLETDGVGELELNGEVVVTAGPLSAEVELQGEGFIYPYFVVTLVSDPESGPDGAAILYLNGTAFARANWAPGDAYVPPPGDARAGLGARGQNPTAAARTALILGAAYNPFAMAQEAVFRHQLACLEAGAMVDGSLGGAFSAGVPTFNHLYSAQRSNAGRGETTFISGSLNGDSVGQVPRAAAVWPDVNAIPSAVNLARVDDGPATCFTTAVKRIG